MRNAPGPGGRRRKRPAGYASFQPTMQTWWSRSRAARVVGAGGGVEVARARRPSSRPRRRSFITAHLIAALASGLRCGGRNRTSWTCRTARQPLARRPRVGIRVVALQHRALPAGDVGGRDGARGAPLEAQARPLEVRHVVLREVEPGPGQQRRLERTDGGEDPAGAVVVLLADVRDAAELAQVVPLREGAAGPGRGGGRRRQRRRRGEQHGAQERSSADPPRACMPGPPHVRHARRIHARGRRTRSPAAVAQEAPSHVPHITIDKRDCLCTTKRVQCPESTALPPIQVSRTRRRTWPIPQGIEAGAGHRLRA